MFLLFLASSKILSSSDVVICKKPFCLYWDDHAISAFECIYAMFIDFYMLNIPTSLEWIQVDCGEWFLWCVFEFSLQLYCWELLHVCSTGRWVYSFFFVLSSPVFGSRLIFVSQNFYQCSFLCYFIDYNVNSLKNWWISVMKLFEPGLLLIWSFFPISSSIPLLDIHENIFYWVILTSTMSN